MQDDDRMTGGARQAFTICLRQPVDDLHSPEECLKKSISSPHLHQIQILRESIDARKKDMVWLEYQLRFEADPTNPEIQKALQNQQISAWAAPLLEPPARNITVDRKPLIIGFGPSGIFLALQLARLGLEPIVLEQGEPVEDRWRSVQALWQRGELNPLSNMHFGEGGAGTFSDGKLTCGKQSILNQLILKELHQFGGPKDILYRAKPHLGTDNLQKIVRNIRSEIHRLGGEVRFNHRLEDINLVKGRMQGVVVNKQYHPVRQLFLCPGHSARETFRILYERGVAMKAKPMAVGLRVEHPRDFIDSVQYGQWRSYLPAAEYKLTTQVEQRGVYSFCMCPGGQIVCTSSEPDGIVINGMSYYSRNLTYSNSAIVVSISSTDYPTQHPLAGIEFQRSMEQRAYFSSPLPFTAPAQTCQDFFSGRVSRIPPSRPTITTNSIKPIKTSYQPAIRPADLSSLLPSFLTRALQQGLVQFEKKIRGFIEQGTLVGVETRTSSPVYLLRNEDWESVNTKGLYLFGEGAGYAGGIMTSALDAYKFSLRVRA